MRAPSAELRENQTDQDTLPPYDVLDQILERLVEREESIATIIAAGFDRDTVVKVERMLYLAEYKRRQAAPGVKVTLKNFGRDRRYPIVNRFLDPGTANPEPDRTLGQRRGNGEGRHGRFLMLVGLRATVADDDRNGGPTVRTGALGGIRRSRSRSAPACRRVGIGLARAGFGRLGRRAVAAACDSAFAF